MRSRLMCLFITIFAFNSVSFSKSVIFEGYAVKQNVSDNSNIDVRITYSLYEVDPTNAQAFSESVDTLVYTAVDGYYSVELEIGLAPLSNYVREVIVEASAEGFSGARNTFVVAGNAGFGVLDLKQDFTETHQICTITSDSTTGNNLVVWERRSGFGVAGYVVLKENQRGIYDSIGYKAYKELSVFEDLRTDKYTQASYKIQPVYSDFQKGSLSPAKKSLLIDLPAPRLISPRLAQIEFSFSSFVNSGMLYIDSIKIYRGRSPLGMALLKAFKLGPDASSFIDGLTENGVYYYQVAAVLKNTCDPRAIKTDSGPFSHSISNIAEVELTELENVTAVRSANGKEKLFNAEVMLSEAYADIYLPSSGNLTIVDVSGKEHVSDYMDMGHFRFYPQAKGVYFAVFSSKEGVKTARLLFR